MPATSTDRDPAAVLFEDVERRYTFGTTDAGVPYYVPRDGSGPARDVGHLRGQLLREHHHAGLALPPGRVMAPVIATAYAYAEAAPTSPLDVDAYPGRRRHRGYCRSATA